MYPPPGPPGWPPQQPQQPQGWGALPQQSYAPPPPAQIPPGSVMCGTCRYVGPPRVTSVGGPSGCLAILLLCFGIVPGVLYLLFASSQKVYSCQNCGNGTGPGGGSSSRSGCLIVLLVVLVLGALTTISQILHGA